MGTKVHSKSYLPEYFSMRECNDDSSSNWTLFYGDKTVPNGQYYSDFLPRTVTNGYSGYDKNALKQTMLEHEKIFRHQVLELHRLYKIQKDMMDGFKRKELLKRRVPMEASSSSSPRAPQMPSEDSRKWHKPNFSLMNSPSVRPSVSGAEMISSPLSCTGGKSLQAGQSLLLQKCNSSKDCEILESRPSKVRKKLFDLDLPADEYIDTEEEEQSVDNKVSEVSSFPSSKSHRTGPQDSVKLRSHVGLADLNEPAGAEEMALPNSIGHGNIRDLNQAAKPKSQSFLGLPKEMFENSQHGSNNGTLSNPHIENKGNGRDWLSSICEAGKNKARLHAMQGLQTDKSPLPPHLMHKMHNKVHQPFGVLLPDCNTGDLWRERPVGSTEQIINSNFPHPHSSFHSSDMENAWSQSVSGWGKPNRGLTNDCSPIQIHTPPLQGSLSRSSQSPANVHEIFGDKWHLHNNSRLKTGMGSGLGPNRNGFYQGSSSGSKNASPLPSFSFDYLNGNKDGEVGYDHRTVDYDGRSYFKGSNGMDLWPAKDFNGSNGMDLRPAKDFNGSNGMDMRPGKDFNLNTVLPKYPSNEVVYERRYEEHSTALPWLKYKPACKNTSIAAERDLANSSEASFLQAGNIFPDKSESVKGPNQHFSDREVGVNRKILGVPIFEDSVPNNEFSLISSSASLRRAPWSEDMKRGGKNGMIDINMACDPESTALTAPELPVAEKEKGKDKEVASYRTHIDLNSCMSEEEIVPSVAASRSMEIDLEAPPLSEAEEEDVPHAEEQNQHEMPLEPSEQPQDEADRLAAEAIVSISAVEHLNRVEEIACDLAHPVEVPSVDSLLWFAEVISSSADNLNKKRCISSSDEIDDFEAMALSLPELTEEEYMPKPLVDEDETGLISMPTRARKGPARRGRQRRDFQRDILPGLASLSRHEVTEDLQTFGGLMRATGHSWQSGPNRRNGGRNGGAARGRRRSAVEPAPAAAAVAAVCTPLVQQLNNIEVGLEDRCLTTGWGKTPRRPRRQRCPASNPPLIPLT